MKRKMHILIRDTLRGSDNNKQVFRVGICVGYWPCLLAPFLQISVGKKTIDIWFGMPSYRYP